MAAPSNSMSVTKAVPVKTPVQPVLSVASVTVMIGNSTSVSKV